MKLTPWLFRSQPHQFELLLLQVGTVPRMSAAAGR